MADEVELHPGDVLLQEGRIGVWFFLIAAGTATRTRAGLTTGELGPGDHVGEVAILGLGPQPATIEAKTVMRAFVVSRQHFLPLAHDMPVIQRRLFPAVIGHGYAATLRDLRTAGAAEWKQAAEARARAGVALAPPRRLDFRPGRPAQPGAVLWSALAPSVFATPRPPPPPVAAHHPLGWASRSAIAVAVAGVVGLVGWAYHPPMLVVRPLPAVDVSRDIVVTGTPVHRIHGRYLLLTVRLERPNGFGAFVAMVTHKRRLPLDTNPGPATPGGEPNSVEAFQRSQQQAAAAAATMAGFDVRLRGTGATVLDAIDHAGPSELLPGDVIVAVEGQPVRTAPDVARLSTAHASGPLAVTVERFGGRVDVTVLRSPRETQTGALRVVLETRDATFSLPFRVTFRSRPIGGPSGGLIYALALADMLGPGDLAHGRTVAATGAIDPAGDVAPVGFVADKSAAVRWARTSELLVPADQVADAVRGGRRVRGVLTLGEAIRVLAGDQ